MTARGAGRNTYLLQNLKPSPLTERGYLKVLPSLQRCFNSNPILQYSRWEISRIFRKLSIARKRRDTHRWSFQHAQLFGKRRTKTTMQARERYLMAGWVFWNPIYTASFVHFILLLERSASYFAIFGGLTFGDIFTKTINSKELFVRLARSFEFIIGWIGFTY